MSSSKSSADILNEDSLEKIKQIPGTDSRNNSRNNYRNNYRNRTAFGKVQVIFSLVLFVVSMEIKEWSVGKRY